MTMLSFQRPSVVRRIWLAERRSDARRGGSTLVCGVWEAFEYGGPVGQLLIVDGAEME